MAEGPKLPSPTWFVGCGNMGRAIIDGWRSAEIDLSNVVVIRPSGAEVPGVHTVKTLAEAGVPPKLVILGVKPQKLDEVGHQLTNWLTSKTTVVSMLAGVEVASIRARFPKAGPIVRIMPNLPVAVRRGVVGLYTVDGDDQLRDRLGSAFSTLGFAMWMADEAKLAALGSVAGAGPAYVARFIRALAKAGEQRGLSPDIAATIARETVFGTGWMAATTGETMDEIVRRVASPNGTTEAGLAILDRDDVLDQLVAVTIDAAARRGAELAEEAKASKLASEASLH